MNAEEFIRHYKWDVEYKARLTSGEYVMHSPFDDKECKKKPTMSINAETGKWQCFRSGEAGGNLKSLMFKLGLIEMREPAKTHVFVSPTDIKNYQVALLAHKEAMAYLTETRGLLKSSILQFKLGYKLESGKSAIIIPIFDETEACVGYKADFFKRTDSQKYQKLKGTKTQLFNLHRINLNQPVYITEGEYDAISLYQYGFTNVGSVPNGAQGISEWADVLEGAHQVVICFDNDGPGEEGADKLAQKIGRSKCYRVYCKLKDFNECLQCGMSKEDVQANIGSAHAMFNPPVTDIDAYLPGAYKILDNPEEAKGFTTGWKGLDNILGGIRLGEVTASSGFTGDGKCYGKGTPILLYNGDIKKVEDIVVGDVLMGDDSTPRNVLRLARGREQSYKIIPNRGDTFQVNKNHLLVLENNSKVAYGSREKVIRVEDYLKQSSGWKHCHKGIRRGANFPYKEATIDPYALGIWLGDGSSDSGTITNPDKEIHSALGIAKFFNLTDKTKCKQFTLYGIKPLLREYNLLNNKHIPKELKTNSKTYREWLLAGLIDSGGYNNNNNYEIVTKYSTLCEDTKFLARSLGFSAFHTIRYVDKAAHFKVSISGDLSGIPIQVERKKYTGTPNKDVRRFSFIVEDIGEHDYYGFLLDGNHKHLLGDFTVGHNTTFALALASNVIQSSNLHTLIVSPEMREQKLLIELAANYHRKQIETHEELDSFLDKFRNYISIAKVFDQWTHKGSKQSLLDQVFDTLEYSIRNKGTQFIILDHLRLFVNTEQADGERLMIDSFVKRCIHTAVAHNVHIWLIVQPKHVDEASLARCKKCSKVVRKRINRSDFKGSSSIGQDVHNIVLVHRFKKEYCDCVHEVDGSLVEVEVAKNRDTGLEGTVSLEFDMDSRANYIELEE